MKNKIITTGVNIKFWSLSKEDLLTSLKADILGLSEVDAKNRLQIYGPNKLTSGRRQSLPGLFLSQFKSPIVIILLFAAFLSVFLADFTNSIIIFFIILISGLLSFWQEKGARGAVEKLLDVVQIKARVLRDGTQNEIAVEQIVPGDLIILGAGDIIPGDCLVMDAKDLFVDEASLTGETFPVEKNAKTVEEDTPLAKRFNSLYMGTHVVSGTAKALVVNTGKNTEFGMVAEHLSLTPPLTEFEIGIKKFGYLLMQVTLLLVFSIFAINIYYDRPLVDSLLFSLALAVGLTPQLLPAIISINLSHGAKNMAKSRVIVKRLSSIENFGSMNVLCSDKTGTLTEGEVNVKDFIDANGDSSLKTKQFSYLNSFYQTGFKNPIDSAIGNLSEIDIANYKKKDEIPYDFIRKRLSILVGDDKNNILITKGAFFNIIDICSKVELKEGEVVDLEPLKEKLQSKFEDLSKQGYRVVGVGYKNINNGDLISINSEKDLTFLGFIVLFDPPKKGISDTISELKKLGISLKIITGDNQFVAAELARKIIAPQPYILTGKEMHTMSDAAFLQQIDSVDLFAEVEPNQKERILLALKKRGHVVGYIGDGINDASALHVADVGISVDTAVDVAKESADIVLLDKDLNVLIAGVKEGRKTFANTMKYIFMATSANFGNMFSMAGISLFLPFLPLLPMQILLTNLLTDLPEMTIATDNVEEGSILKPRRWDLKFVKRFMITFGLLSAVFDFVTFGILIQILKANEIEFRTGWFVESVLSASLVVLIVRTRKSIFKSRPGKYLSVSVLIVIMITLLLIYTPIGKILGFTPLPFYYLIIIISIVMVYVISAEFLKKIFYRKFFLDGD